MIKSLWSEIKRPQYLFLISLFSVTSNALATDVGEQIDAVISTGAFTYQPYANVTLDQVGRHAYSLPRMRFTVPSESINLIQFTPPSLDSSCGSLSINLGNFSFISLDEAISALRSVAAQSLTYGFGQAVQALCQPCWAGMRDLQKEIQRLNQNVRNTCELSATVFDKVVGDQAIEDFSNNMCQNVWNTLGDDMFSCTKEGGAFSNALGDFNDWIEDSGGDKDSVLTAGNILYEGFERLAGADQDKLIPAATSELFFGTQVTAAEVAMSFFGTSWIGVPEGETDPKQFNREPAITDIKQLLTNPTDCDGNDCLKVWKCGPNAPAYPYKCSDLDPLYVTHDVPDDAACVDGGEAKTLESHLSCLVSGLIEKATNGDLDVASLSTIERMIISSLSLAEQSLFYTGTNSEIQSISIIFSDAYGDFLEKTLVLSYMKAVIGATKSVLDQANDIEDFSAKTQSIKDNIARVEEQLQQYETERDAIFVKLSSNETWADIIKKYRESSAKRVMQLNAEVR